MKTDNLIGRNIKKYREHSGYTQSNIADFLHINREMISYYESGSRDIPIENIEKLSDLFGVEMEDFFEEDDNIVTQNAICAFRTDSFNTSDLQIISEFKAIVKNYTKMTNLMQSV